MNKFTKLPTELLTEIVDLVDSTDLYAISLVNRRFHTLVNPMLWRTVNIAGNVFLTRFISTLVKSDPPVDESLRIVTLKFYDSLPDWDPLPLLEQVILTLARHCHHLSEANFILNPPNDVSFAAFLALGACPLESLKISSVFGEYLDDDNSALDDLANFQYLRCLDIRCFDSHLVQRLITGLTQHPDWLPCLTHLSIDYCDLLTDQQAIAFMETHPALETLSMKRNTLSDVFLEAIPFSLPNLVHLDVAFSFGFTAHAFRQLILGSTLLELIDLFGCNILLRDFYEFDGISRENMGDNPFLKSFRPDLIEIIRQYEGDDGSRFPNV